MTWFVWLGIAVVITAIAAVTGIKPKGTQHLARSRMMTMARIVLVVVIILLVLAYLASRGRSGH